MITYEALKELIKSNGYKMGECWEGLRVSADTIRQGALRNEGIVEPVHYYAVLGWLNAQGKAPPQTLNTSTNNDYEMVIPKGKNRVVLRIED